MVKDGEIVYPGTEFTQNGELPPRKGMTFLKRLFLSFSFIVMMKMEFRICSVAKFWFLFTCL